MEELVKQAFLHVDVIRPYVEKGHYDLVGPNEEIILPQVWESIIEPGWEIAMHMWSMPEPKPAPGRLFYPGGSQSAGKGHNPAGSPPIMITGPNSPKSRRARRSQKT